MNQYRRHAREYRSMFSDYREQIGNILIIDPKGEAQLYTPQDSRDKYKTYGTYIQRLHAGPDMRMNYGLIKEYGE